MFLTQKNHIRSFHKCEYKILAQLTHKSKNLFNHALYLVRQSFFSKGSKILNYEQLYGQLKTHSDYRSLPSQVAQHTLRVVSQSFRSFLALLGLKKRGVYAPVVKIPQYLKKDGHFLAIFPQDMFRIQNDRIRLSLGRYFSKEHIIRYVYFALPSNVQGC
ncbi:MAG: hypothetical protein ACXAD7_06900 [Candidatus Kariarchaeaceae archaeon]